MRRPSLAGSGLFACVLALLALTSEGRQTDTLARRGFTGLEVRNPSASRRYAEVTDVHAGSPANRAGIAKGMKFVRADGQALDSARSLDRLLVRRRVGERVMVEADDGKRFTLVLDSYPQEKFQSADVVLDSVVSSYGDRLRTIITRPRGSTARVPAVFVVGWLSCDSVEYPFGDTDGFGQIPHYLADHSGYAIVRMDKPGVGDSGGPPCRDTDFERELAGYRAAFAAMRNERFIDTGRVIVLGLSNGGGIAPLVVAEGSRVSGYVSISGWARTWYEHMIDAERRRLTVSDDTPEAVNQAMKVYPLFYGLYLRDRQTPGAILQQHPEWRSLWNDELDGQFGRPAAFYQQLQDLNLGKAWQDVRVPVLVIHGGNDSVMNKADSQAVADAVNKSSPGRARYIEVDGADHLMMRGTRVAEEVAPTIMKWLHETTTSR